MNKEQQQKRLYGGKVTLVGAPRTPLADVYVELLQARWWTVLLVFLVVYLGLHAVFASAYLVCGDCIHGARQGSFADAFHFSVQTLSTIGYGRMTPQTNPGHSLVAVEALAGIVGTALCTGMVFAKFARPRARVVFSNRAVVHRRDGVQHLCFRLANARGNAIVEATVRVAAVLPHTTKEGQSLRRLVDLKLVRHRTPFFGISWLVQHRIDHTSPLAGVSEKELRDDRVTLIVSLTGIDNVLSQTVFMQHTYHAHDLVFGSQFVDMLKQDDGPGGMTIDLRRIHKIAPVKGWSDGAMFVVGAIDESGAVTEASARDESA